MSQAGRRFSIKACRLRQSVSCLIFLLLSACANQPLEPGPTVQGKVAEQALALPLSHPKARYYLQDYPQPHPEGWHESLAKLEDRLETSGVDGELLAQVVDDYGSVDLAAMLFIYAVLQQSENQYWQRCLEQLSAALNDGDVFFDDLLPDNHEDYKVVLAPGWLYEDHLSTEAGFSRTRRSLDALGMPYHFIPTPQDGTVTDNAQIIADVIRELSEDERQLILVSASKSAAELHWVLGSLLDSREVESVAAWINAGGVVAGTPLADRWTTFPRSLAGRAAFLWHGWSFDSLRSMRTDYAESRMEEAQLSDEVFILNYVAVPMKSQVTPAAQRRHAYLRRYGPSDALAPLWKTMVPERVTLVEPGADHYFLTVDIRLRTLVMTAMTLNRLVGNACPI